MPGRKELRSIRLKAETTNGTPVSPRFLWRGNGDLIDDKREVKRAHLDTQLYVHDFNFYDWRDPNSTETKNYYRILNDPNAAKAADAIAFHPYWGDPKVMRDAYEQTGKPVHMTETSDLNPATILNYFRLDASSYVMWAQTTDQDGGTLHWTPARDNNLDWDEVVRRAERNWPR